MVATTGAVAKTGTLLSLIFTFYRNHIALVASCFTCFSNVPWFYYSYTDDAPLWDSVGLVSNSLQIIRPIHLQIDNIHTRKKRNLANSWWHQKKLWMFVLRIFQSNTQFFGIFPGVSRNFCSHANKNSGFLFYRVSKDTLLRFMLPLS